MPPKRKGGKRAQGVELSLADLGGGKAATIQVSSTQQATAAAATSTHNSQQRQNHPGQPAAGESRRAADLTRSVNAPNQPLQSSTQPHESSSFSSSSGNPAKQFSNLKPQTNSSSNSTTSAVGFSGGNPYNQTSHQKQTKQKAAIVSRGSNKNEFAAQFDDDTPQDGFVDFESEAKKRPSKQELQQFNQSQPQHRTVIQVIPDSSTNDRPTIKPSQSTPSSYKSHKSQNQEQYQPQNQQSQHQHSGFSNSEEQKGYDQGGHGLGAGTYQSGNSLKFGKKGKPLPRGSDSRQEKMVSGFGFQASDERKMGEKPVKYKIGAPIDHQAQPSYAGGERGADGGIKAKKSSAPNPFECNQTPPKQQAGRGRGGMNPRTMILEQDKASQQYGANRGSNQNKDDDQFIIKQVQNRPKQQETTSVSSQNQQYVAREKIMDTPNVNETIKEQLSAAYDKFDLESVLATSQPQDSSSVSTNENAENQPKSGGDQAKDSSHGKGSKKVLYNETQTRQQMTALVEQLTSECTGVSSASKGPNPETIFGAQAVQPMIAPLVFNIDKKGVNFDAGITPWSISKEAKVSDTLLQQLNEVNEHTLDSIFRFNLADLKQRAAIDTIRFDPNYQKALNKLVNEKLDQIEEKIVKSEVLELNDSQFDFGGKYALSTGLLQEFTLKEPKELFELEEDFVGNPDEILLQQRLEEEQEIDSLLDAASDPFKNEPQDQELDQQDQESSKQSADELQEPEAKKDGEQISTIDQIRTFLRELRDMEVQQRQQQEFSQKEKLLALQNQQAAEQAKASLSLSAKKQSTTNNNNQEDLIDEDFQDEELKEGEKSEKRQLFGDNSTKSSPSEPQDQIDEILSKSDKYEAAVNQNRLFGQASANYASQQQQAEPSHFHLAVVEKERLKNSGSATSKHPSKGSSILDSDTAPLVDAGKAKKEEWVITDKADMKNFKQLVQDPAIEYPFELDDFQKRAVFRLEQGNCVMVAAHTSAGKTLVAEYAIALSRRHMTKTIYTSPIKSLSNQKYRDFKLKFGDVGMLTGDVQLNADASCLIMTTEILQSMLYNDQSKIQDVEWVIFDEVHYINDEQRGTVWEEVIIKLPDTVSIVMLSATVPNYMEFATWVGRVKQKKIYVQYTQQRPVPLQHNSIVDGKMVPLKVHDQPVDKSALIDCTKKRGLLRIKQDRMKNDPDADEESKNQKNKDKDAKKKKIDFKEKAIKAKESSVKKVIAKAVKSANAGGGGIGGSGGGKGPNAQKGMGQKGKKGSNFEKTLLAVQKMNLLPCIVFAFSRAGLVQYAEELDPTIDFTDGYTKGLIKKFIKQKLQRLEENDRDLPQIQTITRLMARGIGVHHAGLLQILKELVEILFSDGYLKVVFATSTFAIGLNLPARSVVFTQMRKFDGQDFSTIQTSEYLQMAGRAGRRGKDDVGFSLICMDPGFQIPQTDELVELLESKGIELESKLLVNYEMCLNSLKQDTDEFSTILKNSFFANETATVKIKAKQEMKRLEPSFSKAQEIECVHGVAEQIKELYEIIETLWDQNEILFKDYLFEPLCIVQVVTGKHVFADAVLVRTGKISSTALVFLKVDGPMPLVYEENNLKGDFDGALKRQQIKNVTGPKGDFFNYEIVEISNCMITRVYDEGIDQINAINLHFLTRTQISEKQLRVIVAEFAKKQPQMKVVPISGRGRKITQKKLNDVSKKQQEIIDQIKKTKCWNCEQVSYHLTQIESLNRTQDRMDEIHKLLQGNIDEKEKDFNSHNAVLAKYKIIDEDMNILYKGKVAMKAVQDKILLTEFFFSGFLTDLTDQELLAILSVFVTSEKASGSVADCGKQYSDKFSAALEFIVQTAEQLINYEQELDVMEEANLNRRLNMKFYELLYDWADQKSFKDVVMGAGIDEGSVVKMIMSVNRTRQAVAEMAQIAGDNALATRLVDMQPLINRGIVKMQSLYLEVEQEPQKLQDRPEDFIVDFTGQEAAALQAINTPIEKSTE